MGERSALAEELEGLLEGVVEVSEDVQQQLDKVRLSIPPLETFVRSLDKVMDSANNIMSAAERSEFNPLVISNALRAHERQMGTIYGNFTAFRDRWESLVKELNIPLRGSKKAGRRKAPSSTKDMTPDQLVDDAKRIMKAMVPAIHSAGDEGAFLLAELRKLGERKKPSPDTVRNEVAALTQDYLNFRNGVYKLFGMVGGMVKRVNARSDIAGGGHIMRYKPKGQREEARPSQDDPVAFLEWAKARDHARGMGAITEGRCNPIATTSEAYKPRGDQVKVGDTVEDGHGTYGTVTKIEPNKVTFKVIYSPYYRHGQLVTREVVRKHTVGQKMTIWGADPLQAERSVDITDYTHKVIPGENQLSAGIPIYAESLEEAEDILSTFPEGEARIEENTDTEWPDELVEAAGAQEGIKFPWELDQGYLDEMEPTS